MSSRALCQQLMSSPPNVDVVTYPGLMFLIDHHLDVRAHAAWNVKDLLTQNFRPPYLVVADYFGDGKPNTDFAVASSPGDFKTADLDEHGYHVLGIIAATFGGSALDRGMATGMYPGPLALWAVDLQYGFDDETQDNLIWNFVNLIGRRTVVNTSLRVPGCNGVLTDKSCIPYMALSWIEKVRGSTLYATGQTGAASLENTFIHLTSTGNIWATPGDTDAALNSAYSAARLLPGLVHPGTGTPIANLNNTLAIENRQKSLTPLEDLGCIAYDSKTPGDLSAVGTNVFSLTGATNGAGLMSGTSMATPQVAGLAAYLWALEPSLTPQDIVDILIHTADASSCGYPSLDPRPMIDAYGAVLAIDRSYSNIKIRRTLLDIADGAGNPGSDNHFNEKDIEAFLGRFSAADGAKDYSRYDLNGDGRTGGTETRSFNLDMDYPPTYVTVHQIVENNSVSFNENNLTDLQILCYYAYSRLYTGDTDKRKDLLSDRCAQLTANVTFPLSIQAGGSGTLQVWAGYLLPNGDPQWSGGISISVSVSGGSAGTSTGATDVNGYFSTTIQHDGVSNSITITVTATDSDGRQVTELATATVSVGSAYLEITTVAYAQYLHPFLPDPNNAVVNSSGLVTHRSSIGPVSYDTGPIPVQFSISGIQCYGWDNGFTGSAQAQAMAAADYSSLTTSGLEQASLVFQNYDYMLCEGVWDQSVSSARSTFFDEWTITPDDPAVTGIGTVLLDVDVIGTGTIPDWGGYPDFYCHLVYNVGSTAGWFEQDGFTVPSGGASYSITAVFTFGEALWFSVNLTSGAAVTCFHIGGADCNVSHPFSNSATLSGIRVFQGYPDQSGAPVDNFRLNAASGHNYGFGHP
jgi:hypothetical protein